jgi:hypothetical protein
MASGKRSFAAQMRRLSSTEVFKRRSSKPDRIAIAMSRTDETMQQQQNNDMRCVWLLLSVKQC